MPLSCVIMFGDFKLHFGTSRYCALHMFLYVWLSQGTILSLTLFPK